MRSPRTRAAGLVLNPEKTHIAIMRREKQGRRFAVFPGGGVEEGESIEAALAREVKEEVGLTIGRYELWYELVMTDGERHYFFLCEAPMDPLVVSGPELARASKENIYDPVWLPIKELQAETLFPVQIKEAFVGDFASGAWDAHRNKEIKYNGYFEI